jgi:hypothetical protein
MLYKQVKQKNWMKKDDERTMDMKNTKASIPFKNCKKKKSGGRKRINSLAESTMQRKTKERV